MPRKTLNLGILAHVDAGKTTLTERLLYAAGVIDEIGSVDAGTTQTDSLALERQRGITIKSAVASFPIGDVTVNLIDTPGHPDFIAEVERVLSVLDGAVLVDLRGRGRAAADPDPDAGVAAAGDPDPDLRQQDRPRRRRDERVLGAIAERLTWRVIPMGSATRSARATPASCRGARMTPASRRGWPSCWPSETTACWPPTCDDDRASLSAAAGRAGRVRPGVAGPPGVLRLGDHRRRRGRADGRDRRAAAGLRRRR